MRFFHKLYINKNIKKSCYFFLLLAISLFSCEEKRVIYGEVDVPQPDHFMNGEKVCFLGNSITQAGYFHYYIDLFHKIRYPNKRIKVINAGISGNQTKDALKRIKRDVFASTPSCVAIMLGMNDVGVYLHTNKTNRYKQREIEKRFSSYQQGYQKILNALKKRVSQIELLSVTPYEQTAYLDTTESIYHPNQELKKYSEFTSELALDNDYAFLNFFDSLIEINKKMQETDSTFTIIGKDRIHPGKLGHLVMALNYLKSKNYPDTIFKISIDANKDSIKAYNGNIINPKITQGKISFKFIQHALPFPINALLKDLKPFFPIKKINKEILQIKGLEQGTYKIAINGKRVSSFNEKDFEKGINLSNYTDTPQYRKALKVADLLLKKHEIIAFKLQQIKFLRDQWGFDSDIDQLKEEVVSAKESRYLSALEEYLTLVKEKPIYIKSIQKLEEGVYQLLKPSIYKYSITLL